MFRIFKIHAYKKVYNIFKAANILIGSKLLDSYKDICL